MPAKRKSRINVLMFSIISVSIDSCKTALLLNYKNPYSCIETVHYENSQTYVFRSEMSDKLLIIIGGIGWLSVDSGGLLFLAKTKIEIWDPNPAESKHTINRKKFLKKWTGYVLFERLV